MNQPDYDCIEPMKLSLTFSHMDIITAPHLSAIYLMETGSYMGLDFVAAVDCEPHVLGDLLKITCKDGERYVVVAQ